MIYLIHFQTNFKHARHYVGFVEQESGLEERLKKHRGGTGAKLMRAVSNAGIDFLVARVWPNGDRNAERKIKNRKETPTLCPVCNVNAMALATDIGESKSLATLTPTREHIADAGPTDSNGSGSVDNGSVQITGFVTDDAASIRLGQ